MHLNPLKLSYCYIFYLYVTVCKLAIFRVTFVLQGYRMVKCAKLLHSIDVKRLFFLESSVG